MAYTFYWSPTGRTIDTVRAESYTKAQAQFKAMNPSYARFMGEVYWTAEPPSCGWVE